jgi:hypothetical protein
MSFMMTSPSIWTVAMLLSFSVFFLDPRSDILLHRVLWKSTLQWTKTSLLPIQITSVADADPYFLGLLDPDPDPLVRGMDPSIVKQNRKKNLGSYCFVTSF